MQEYVISDTHFGHEKIIGYCDRPFSTVEEMDETMIERWNAFVSPEDTVYMLGDFGFGNSEKIENYVSRLNGYKILVMGNHDIRLSKKTEWWKSRGFDEVYKGAFQVGNVIFRHWPTPEEQRDPDKYYIYGHVHNSEDYSTVQGKSICASVERWNYRPVPLEQLMEEIHNGGGDCC